MSKWKRGSQHSGVKPQEWRSGNWYQQRYQQGGQGSQGYQQGYQGSQGYRQDRPHKDRFWNRVHNGYSSYFASEENQNKTITSTVLAKLTSVKTKIAPATKKGTKKECRKIKYDNCIVFGEYQEATCKVVEKA